MEVDTEVDTEKLIRELEEAKDIIKRHELIWTNAPKNPRKTFTPQEIDRFFEIIEDRSRYHDNQYGHFLLMRNRTILAFLYLLGTRPKETTSLKFEDLDFRNQIVTIRGENNKTGNGRILPLPKNCLIYLKQYLELPGYFWQNSDYLFPSQEDRSRPVSTKRWSVIFREVLQEAGIWLPPAKGTSTPPYSSYSLRHTRLSEVLAETHDLNLTASIAGHKKLESTKSYLSSYVASRSYYKKMREVLEGGK